MRGFFAAKCRIFRQQGNRRGVLSCGGSVKFVRFTQGKFSAQGGNAARFGGAGQRKGFWLYARCAQRFRPRGTGFDRRRAPGQWEKFSVLFTTAWQM